MRSVGLNGRKITPEDIHHVLLRIDGLAAAVSNFALHPYEDEGANKRLELWFELAAVNQDARESIRMVPAERRPSVRLFPFDESPISAQDVRIKREYIVGS